ncbi:MAG: hypothetical protein ACKVPX_15100 [Myxococcaceae bacterium]
MKARFWTACVLALSVVGATPSWGQTLPKPAEGPKKVVLDVQGPHAALLRKTLGRALSRSGFEVGYSRAGALKKKVTPKGVARLIRRRSAVALMMASVDKRTGRFVMLRVYGKGHFSKPAETKWSAEGTRALRKVPERRLARIAEFLRTLPGPRAPVALPPVRLPLPVVPESPREGATETPPVAATEASPPTAVAQAPLEAEGTPSAAESAEESAPPDLGVSLDEPETETSASPSPLEVSVGVRGFSRRLAVADVPTQPFPRYRLGLGPSVVAEVDWFPGAHFSQGWVAHLGLTLGIETGFALRSTVGETVYPTDAQAFHVGVKGRIPLGSVQILPAFVYATRSFNFLPSLNRFEPAPVPDVAYRGPRATLDFHWVLVERFAVRVGGGFQAIPVAGELGSSAFFPRLKGNLVDAQVGLFVGLLPGWWLRGAVNFSHIFLWTHAEAGDRFSGESGLDQSWGASLALVFRLS